MEGLLWLDWEPFECLPLVKNNHIMPERHIELVPRSRKLWAFYLVQPEHAEALEEINNTRVLVLKRQQDSNNEGQRLKVI